MQVKMARAAMLFAAIVGAICFSIAVGDAVAMGPRSGRVPALLPPIVRSLGTLSASAQPLGPPPPCSVGVITNTVPPVISPTAAVTGTTYTTTNGSWTSCQEPITGYTYQWYLQWNLDFIPIVGATAQSYTSDAGGEGHALAVAVDAHNADGDLPAWSSNSIAFPNVGPYPPTLASPVNGSTVQTTTPTLSANTTDPGGDSISGYDFVLVGTASCAANPIADSGWQSASTWTVPYGKITGAGTYWWCARAQDAPGAVSDWGGAWSFVVASGSPPNAPTLVSPAATGPHGEEYPPSITPSLTVSGTATSSVAISSFNVRVTTDSACGAVGSLDPQGRSWITVPVSVPSTTSKGTFTIPSDWNLANHGTYYWCAQAVDALGGVSAQSATFTVVPSAPQLGDSSIWPMFRVREFAVNEANGNLVVALGGPSYPTSTGSISAALTYNSQSTTGPRAS
jgi:hypothetical protein